MSGSADSQPGATGSAVPFPEHELANPPDAAEVGLIAGAVANAVAPVEGLTPVQRAVLNSMCESLLGVPLDLGREAPVGPEEFAEIMRPRGRDLRTRVVHAMLLGELLLSPLPVEVPRRVETYAARLGVRDDMIDVARDLAHGSLGLTPWEPAGMTSYQNQQGHRASRAAGRGYQSFGATQPQLEADPNAPTGASKQQ